MRSSRFMDSWSFVVRTSENLERKRRRDGMVTCMRCSVAGRTLSGLSPIKAEDHTDDMLEALRAAGVPYERTEEGVRIWGYLRPGTSPNWDHAT
jgi:hypothetical protein